MDGWMITITNFHNITSTTSQKLEGKKKNKTHTYIHPELTRTLIIHPNFIFIFIHPFKWCNILDIHGCNFFLGKRSDP